MHNLISKVPFKYHMIRLTAIQCIGPSSDINQLIMLIANVRSNLVATIAYINDPIVCWYKISFISYKCSSCFSSESFTNEVFASSGILMGLQFPMPDPDVFIVASLMHGNGADPHIPPKMNSEEEMQLAKVTHLKFELVARLQCHFYVNLMHFKVHSHPKCKYASNGVEFGHGCKGFTRSTPSTCEHLFATNLVL